MRPITPPVVLSVAGTDPCGGAGVTADLLVMRDLGALGASVVTAVLAQNTRGVRACFPLPPEQVLAQLQALLDDVEVAAVKLGALATAEVAEALAGPLGRWRAGGPGRSVVLDPVLASGQNGQALGGQALAEAIVDHLLPLCDVVTPNVGEAAALTGLPEAEGREALVAAGRALCEAGAGAALMKVGHLPALDGDLLVLGACGPVHALPLPRRFGYDVRGTGCHLSSAIACGLAAGAPVVEAVSAARRYLDRLWAERAVAPGGGARVFYHGEPPL